MYQGHHQDGSSIQKHSTGSHYPYIVGKREGSSLPWFILDPSGREVAWLQDGARAFELADGLARNRKGA